MSLPRSGPTSTEHTPDLSQRWQQHLRQKAKTTVTLACPYCTDNRIFFEEPALFEHVTTAHKKYVQGFDDGRLADFRQELREKAERKDQSVPSNRTPTPNTPSKAPSRLVSSTKRPVSASAVTFSGRQVPKEIPEFKDLSIEPPQDSLKPEADRVQLSPIHGTRKRSANAEPLHSEASPGFSSTTNPINPRRAKARSGSGFFGSGQFPLDPDFDRKVQVPTNAEIARTQPNPRRTLFDPATDPSALSVRKDSDRPYGSSPASHVYDSRAHVFRSKKETTRRKGHRPLEYEKWQPSFQAQMQTASPEQEQKSGVKQVLPGLIKPGDFRVLQQTRKKGPCFVGTEDERHPELVMQPETRPISQEQLVAEVKGIYAGLVMVEAKCIEVDSKQIDTTQGQSKLSNEQFQALIALHRTLLHEHHDFFLASQHPSASPALRRLASKYAMPARMWRHGIHSFLELLRHRLPASLDHMLAFIYVAYSMVALLYETVPTFEDTWIECLGDLGRYRMAIEDDDIRDREVWTGVARFWYSKAADKSPMTGRLYHHLAILARPNALQQLYYYAKSLSVSQLFLSARESILTLFEPFLGSEQPYHRSQPVEAAFIRAHALHFTRVGHERFPHLAEQFLSLLDNHIGRVTAKWKEQGVYIAVANFAALLGFGSKDSALQQALEAAKGAQADTADTSGPSYSRFTGNDHEQPQDLHNAQKFRQTGDTDIAGRRSQDLGEIESILPQAPPSNESEDNQAYPPKVSTHELAAAASISNTAFTGAKYLTFATLNLAAQRIGDHNVLPHIHVSLIFFFHLTFFDGALELVETDVPWKALATHLNILLVTPEPFTAHERMQSSDFPEPEEDGQPLPEDFSVRGLDWATNLHPEYLFSNATDDDGARSLQLPSVDDYRRLRVLWSAYQVSKATTKFQYDQTSRTFSGSVVAKGKTAHSEYDADTKMSGTQDYQSSLSEPGFTPQAPSPLLLDHKNLSAQSFAEKVQDSSMADDPMLPKTIQGSIKPFFTTLVVDKSIFIHKLSLFETLASSVQWSVAIPDSVFRELKIFSQGSGAQGQPGNKALEAIKFAVNSGVNNKIVTMQGNDVTAEMLAEASIGAYAQDGPENYEDYLLYTVEAQGKIKHAGADPGYKDSAALQDSAQAAVLISEQSPLIDLAGARGIIALSPSSLESMLKSMSEEYSLG